MSNNRPPLNQGPQPSPRVIEVRAGEECAALPALRAAYLTLLAGGQTQQVRDGDRWQTFQPANARLLKVEIRRLEILCDTRRTPGAIQIGSHRHGPYGGYGWPFGRNWPY